jgi:hypothetical protein
MKVKITPKHWERFQHYKDRSPSWIKLHRQLLDDYEFHCLPVASRALAPLLWLLASEYRDGQIVGSVKQIAFRLHMAEPDFVAALDPLIQAGFFSIENDVDECKQAASTLLAPCLHDASAPLAERKQDASPEKERETETEIKTEIKTELPIESQSVCLPCASQKNTATQQKMSVVPADGDAALRAPPSAAADPRTELFSTGLSKLAAITGRTPNACRSLLGRWLKLVEDEAIHVVGLIEEAERNRIVDPVAWIERHLRVIIGKRGGKANGRYDTPDRDRSVGRAAERLAVEGISFGPRPQLAPVGEGPDIVRLLPKGRSG